jgi:hypothetical protein
MDVAESVFDAGRDLIGGAVGGIAAVWIVGNRGTIALLSGTVILFLLTATVYLFQDYLKETTEEADDEPTDEDVMGSWWPPGRAS